jgi:hypothetical protein
LRLAQRNSVSISPIPKFLLVTPGKVAYWRVLSLQEAIDRFKEAGAELYRGPLAIESGQGICQFADPFGNLFGLVGAFNGAAATGPFIIKTPFRWSPRMCLCHPALHPLPSPPSLAFKPDSCRLGPKSPWRRAAG